MPAKVKKLKVNAQFDYISIKFPVGTFTLGRSGERGTNLPRGVFERLVEVVKRESAKPGCNYLTAMQFIVDHIDAIWPEWNAPQPVFAVGDRVKLPNGKVGTVIKKRSATGYNVRFDGDSYVTGVSVNLLSKVN